MVGHHPTTPTPTPGEGTPSIYIGWYICAAVWPPFLNLRMMKYDLLGYFSNPPTPKRSFWVPILPELDLIGPKFHFCLDLLGFNFQWNGEVYLSCHNYNHRWRQSWHHENSQFDDSTKRHNGNLLAMRAGCKEQGPLSLTWFNFNRCMVK